MSETEDHKGPEPERDASNGNGTDPFEDLAQAFKHIRVKVVIFIAVVVALGLYALSGFYTVDPGHRAVVKRFGRVIQVAGEGAHYRLPWPIDSVERVNIKEVRREGVGMSLPEHDHPVFLPETLQLLTGDENVVNTEAIIHYTVKDPVRHLYSVNFAEERLIRNAVASTLVELMGHMAVDDILTAEKKDAQRRILLGAQRMLDLYESGLEIIAFNIRAIIPPVEVADAFRDVTAAREDKERIINQAKGYEMSVIPEARGKAEEALREAEGYRIDVTNRARGDADKFLAILAEYRKNREIYSDDLTRYRLYLETMEKVLPRVKKYIVNPSKDGGKVGLRFMDGR